MRDYREYVSLDLTVKPSSTPADPWLCVQFIKDIILQHVSLPILKIFGGQLFHCYDRPMLYDLETGGMDCHIRCSD